MLGVKIFITIFAIAAAYTDVNDNHFAALLGDQVKLKQYFKCMVDKTTCDAYGQTDKNHMVELLSDGCRECDSKQKHYAHILITIAKADFPDIYEAFEAKYDPKRNLLENLNTQTKDL